MKILQMASLVLATGWLALAPLPATAADASNLKDSSGFLSGPAKGDALDIALDYATTNHQALGLTTGDFEDLVVSDRYVSRKSGVTHIYLQQRLQGVEVYNGLLNLHVMPDGRIVHLGNRWVSALASTSSDRAATLSAEEAVQRAAFHLRLEITDALVPIETIGGPANEVLLSDGGISQEDIPARLVYQKQDDGSVRLAWNVGLRLLNGENWWQLRVDASNGDILDQNDWIAADSYRVFAAPLTDPEDGAHTIVTDPADASASPFGWHDTNGAAGAEFTDTRGNNVEASEDTDANNVPGFRPSGGGGNDYDFAFDGAMGPMDATNQEAAIVNLFYWNNNIHDVMWHHGFDEASGNFQTNNYGNGGIGGDPVQADAQDGSGTNNANFATPPDGNDPRMQMFIWTNPFPNVTQVNSPGPIAGDYTTSGASFGPAFDLTGITADVEYVNDGDDEGGTQSVNDGCQALVGFTAGRIALIDRGGCPFVQKVQNAQAALASAAIIVNNAAGPPITLGGADPGGLTISAGMISMADGDIIKAEVLVGGGVNATVKSLGSSVPDRDSDNDNTVIVHEYGHGISNRLTGGPANSGCLGNQEQMGEGWSDWYGLVLTAKDTDTATQARGIAPYVAYQPPTGPGIRRFPYSTDTAINPDTFATIGTGIAVPHGVGSVWAAIAWDMYWGYVDAHGFNSDFTASTGGNNLANDVVTEGLKMQPCGPGFVSGRDGILAAELALTGGANRCLIWNAFAARGMGVGASSGSVNVLGDEIESFTPPVDCNANAIFLDGFESGDTSAWSLTFP